MHALVSGRQSLRLLSRDVTKSCGSQYYYLSRGISTVREPPPRTTAATTPDSTSFRRKDNRKPTRRRYALVDRPDVTEGHARPSQRPFGVAKHIEDLFKSNQEHKLDEAIKMVSSAPMSSQNVVVWTLLIKQALSENLPNLAFTLFNNMKRRGFQPNERTYATIFSGYNQLPELTDKQWDRVTGIWNQYQSFLEVAKLQDAHTRSSQSLVSPYVPYFEMLGKRGEYERLMEIFQSMDVDGPFAPDKFVYTTVLLQIGQRRYMSGVNGATSTASDDALIQNAQNTIAIADRMRETSAFDSFALSAILRGLMKGTDEHRQYGYDLLADVFGATPDNANFLESTTTELDHRLLDLVLELCCTMEKYDLVLDLFSKLKSSNKLKSLLTRSHMDYVLDSISFLAARSIPTSSEIDPSTPEPPPTSTKYSNEAMSVLEFMLHEGYGGHSMDILPNRGTYTRVLVTAWRCNDWTTATRVFEIMTGFDHKDFISPSTPPRSQKSPKTIVHLDAQAMSYLVRIALAQKDPVAMKVALNIVGHYGTSKLLPVTSSKRPWSATSTRAKMGDYHQMKLASAIQGCIILLMDGSLTQVERAKYKLLLDDVKRAKARLKQEN